MQMDPKGIPTMNGTYNLKIHELENSQQKQLYYPEKLFEKQLPGVLVGVNGAGKTRAIYEQCSSNFGYYLTLDPSVEGASDFQMLWEQSKEAIVNKTSDVARNLVYRLILARLLVLEQVLEVKPSITPYEFLLLQLYPKEFFGQDFFGQIFQALQSAKDRDVLACIKEFYGKQNEPVFYFDNLDVLLPSIEDEKIHKTFLTVIAQTVRWKVKSVWSSSSPSLANICDIVGAPDLFPVSKIYLENGYENSESMWSYASKYIQSRHKNEFLSLFPKIQGRFGFTSTFCQHYLSSFDIQESLTKLQSSVIENNFSKFRSALENNKKLQLDFMSNIEKYHLLKLAPDFKQRTLELMMASGVSLSMKSKKYQFKELSMLSLFLKYYYQNQETFFKDQFLNQNWTPWNIDVLLLFSMLKKFIEKKSFSQIFPTFKEQENHSYWNQEFKISCLNENYFENQEDILKMPFLGRLGQGCEFSSFYQNQTTPCYFIPSQYGPNLSFVLQYQDVKIPVFVTIAFFKEWTDPFPLQDIIQTSSPFGREKEVQNTYDNFETEKNEFLLQKNFETPIQFEEQNENIHLKEFQGKVIKAKEREREISEDEIAQIIKEYQLLRKTLNENEFNINQTGVIRIIIVLDSYFTFEKQVTLEGNDLVIQLDHETLNQVLDKNFIDISKIVFQ